MMNKIDFEADDAVTTVKLKDGTEIRVKFIISAVLFDSKTGNYHFEYNLPTFQFIKNTGEFNLEVKK